jgi:hypothetical protein
LAEQFVRETLTVLPGNHFSMSHVWAFLLRVEIALYTGDGSRSWSLVHTQWPELAQSQVLRVEFVAIAALDVRARSAIAAAAMNDGARDHAGEALKCARQLARKHARWATSLSLLIRAGIANVRRERQGALDLLQQAEAEFRACEMALHVATCQARRGTLTGGEEGRELIAAAETWANAQRVVNPARLFDMLAPGKWEPV